MKKKICDALKELGVKEVIIESEDPNCAARIIFGTDDGSIEMTSSDFSEEGI